jgi:hypothetical protein
MKKTFDLFHVPSGVSLEEQRAFEIYWKKYTGRTALAISGVEYVATLEGVEEEDNG